jgi:hypothetical protein
MFSVEVLFSLFIFLRQLQARVSQNKINNMLYLNFLYLNLVPTGAKSKNQKGGNDYLVHFLPQRTRLKMDPNSNILVLFISYLKFPSQSFPL